MTTPDSPDDPKPNSDHSPDDTALRERLLSNVIAALVPENHAMREFRDNRSKSRLALLRVDESGRAGEIQFNKDDPGIPFKLTLVDGEPAITADWPDGNRPISILKCLARTCTGAKRWTVQLPLKSRPLAAQDRVGVETVSPSPTRAAPVMGAMRAEAVRGGGFGASPTVTDDGVLSIPSCPDVGDEEIDEAVFVVEATMGRRTITVPFLAERAAKSPGLTGRVGGFREKLSEFATEISVTVRPLEPEDWLELPPELVEVALETAQLGNRSLMETQDPRSFAFVSDPAPFFKSDDATEAMWLVRYLPKADTVEGALS